MPVQVRPPAVLRVEKTLINSMFSLFLCGENVCTYMLSDVCKKFCVSFYAKIEIFAIMPAERRIRIDRAL